MSSISTVRQATLRRAARLAAAVTLVVIGCSTSTPPQFYTLIRPVPKDSPTTSASFQLEVLPVDVPAQVDVPQLVLREGQGTLVPVDSRRWIAPLNTELRSALSQELSHTLGARDVHNLWRPPGVQTIRVKMSVQRFDSVLDKYALVEAVWTLREVTGSQGDDVISSGTAGAGAGPTARSGKGALRAALICSSRVREPAREGYTSLAEAHQRALVAVASQIVVGIKALRSGSPACP